MKKILIVEDEADLRESLKDILEMNGYQALAAENGREGLWIANSDKPDLIISDIMMPEMNGFQFLEMLQKNVELANIPFIFLSARGEDYNLREGMNLGADDYLTKPVKMNVLLEVITRRMAKVENQQKAFEQKYKEVLTTINLATQHEFNTPLNSIIGFSQLLLNYPALPVSKRNHFIKAIAEAGLRLKSTLDNIMLYRAIISNQVSARNENFTLDNLHLLDWLRPILEKHKRENDFSIPDAFQIQFICSKDHLYKILSEAVDNACKFSEHSTPISLHYNSHASKPSITVQNKLNENFDVNFAQIDAFLQSNNRMNMTGIGLGLFICTRLAEINGWKFSLAANKQDQTVLASLSFE